MNQVAANTSQQVIPFFLPGEILTGTDEISWRTSLRRNASRRTKNRKNLTTETSEEVEGWEKQVCIYVHDVKGRHHAKSICSFANSEETGLLLSELEVKVNSSEFFYRMENPESEFVSGATRVSNTQELQAKHSIYDLFESYAHVEFEDGMDNGFVDELTDLIIKYGRKAVYAIVDIVAGKVAKPQLISEALRWLGLIKHPASYKERLYLLEVSLRSPSRWIRDGAALGLASLNDINAIPYLREAIDREQILDLRKDMELVLERLGR